MDMNKEQAEVLNTVQQVLRAVVMAAGALAPQRIGEMSAMLAAHAQHPGLDPVAQQMLIDLAQGPGMMAAAGDKRRQ